MVKILQHFFDSQANFLDPVLTADGKPYAPERLKEIIKECYLISKQTNTSYTDVRDKITPRERDELLKLIQEEFLRNKKEAEKLLDNKANK